VSFLSNVFSALAPAIGAAFGPVGAVVGTAVGAALAPKPRAPAPVAPALAAFSPQVGIPNISLGAPSVPVQLSTQGAQIGRAFGATVPAAAGGACPVGFHLDKRSRSRCVRNRRMNPLNGRAAMRAIRRIKGARKMLQKIERQLPRSKARRTPAHGHRVRVEAT